MIEVENFRLHKMTFDELESEILTASNDLDRLKRVYSEDKREKAKETLKKIEMNKQEMAKANRKLHNLKVRNLYTG